MIGQPDNEQRLLEEKLNTALEEAWSKANLALAETTEQKDGFEKKIWEAAEATEYTSLLFSLTHGLEDVNPPVPSTKGQTQVSLLKESVDALKRARQKKDPKLTEQYGVIRSASARLQAAYLQVLKSPRKSR